MFDREMRDAAHINRWSILRRSRNQSIAEHSYYVAVYCVEIAEYIDWEGDRHLLLRHALAHDLPEIWSGDLPGPTKRAITDTQRLHDFEYAQMHKILPFHRPYCRAEGEIGRILEVADRLEATLFLADEWGMGNKSVGDIEDLFGPFGSNLARLKLSVLSLPCQEDMRRALMGALHTSISTAANGVSRIFLDPKEPDNAVAIKPTSNGSAD
jgi:5'-deoxynucleotidase YfbR-like HD superfamily hydrolase